MDDTLSPILGAATEDELAALFALLDRHPKDRELASAYDAFLADRTGAREPLHAAIEGSLRRAGSSEIGWAARRVIRRAPSVSTHQVITDVASRLHVLIPPMGTVRGRLQRFASALVDKTFLALDPDVQRRLIAEQLDAHPHHGGTEPVEHIKTAAESIAVPALRASGREKAAKKLAEQIATRGFAAIMGREAAAAVLRAVLPLLSIPAAVAGPVAWGAAAAWLAVDLQGPAYRKTVPAVVNLSLIAARTPNG
jgi:hypothetical protein